MKKIVFVLLLCVGFTYASAQEVYNSSGKPGYQKHMKKKKKGYDPDKLIIGGVPNVSFSDGYVDVGLSAMLGYRITEHFSAGIGLGYLYAKTPYATDPNNPNNILYENENIIYPNLWAQYFVYRGFFVVANYEYDIISDKVPIDNMGYLYPPATHYTNSCMFLGVGYRWRLSGRVSVFAEGVYDVLQNRATSPYYPGEPMLRIGLAVGL